MNNIYFIVTALCCMLLSYSFLLFGITTYKYLYCRPSLWIVSSTIHMLSLISISIYFFLTEETIIFGGLVLLSILNLVIVSILIYNDNHNKKKNEDNELLDNPQIIDTDSSDSEHCNYNNPPLLSAPCMPDI